MSLRCTFGDATGSNFGGFYFLNGILPPGETQPQLTFGTLPNSGMNLTGARTLPLWARDEQGGEVIEFFMCGVGRDPMSGAPVAPFPDSTSVVKIYVTLTKERKQYSIDVRGRHLSYVLGGFG